MGGSRSGNSDSGVWTGGAKRWDAGRDGRHRHVVAGIELG